MWHYITLYSIIAFILLIMNKRQQLSGVCSMMLVLILSLFSSVRIGAGQDYALYRSCFENPLSYSSLLFEKSWIVINYLFKILDLNYHYWLLFTSFVTNTLMFLGAKKLRLNITIFTILYLCYHIGFSISINLVRQTFGMSIFFYGLSYLLNGKFWKYTFWVVLASLFHTSSIIMIGLYPLVHTRILRSGYWFVVLQVLSFVIGRFYLKEFLDSVYPFIPERYAQYIPDEDLNSKISTGIYQILINILGLYGLYNISLNKENKEFRNVVYVVLYSFIGYNFLFNSYTALRIVYYPMLALYPFVSMLYDLAKNTFYKVLSALIVCLYLMIGIKDLFSPQTHYNTVFENVDLKKDKI